MAVRSRRGVTTTVPVHRIGDRTGMVQDIVPTEEPLEILVNGVLVGTTMRTPGHDFELVAGWSLSEGHLVGDRIDQIRYCAGKGAEGNSYNVLDISTDTGRKPTPTRLTTSTASCGICGTVAIDELGARLEPLELPAPVPFAALTTAAETLRDHQAVFAKTGSVHAAAVFSLADGSILEVREDVGRHNATDKVIGRLLLDQRLPALGMGLFLSGRVSVELVQKAWAAGIALGAAVGGPTSLAVEAARASGMTLVGFVRSGRANVYTGSLAQ